MPPDNATPIVPGGSVVLPDNGVIANTDIGRTDESTFLLAEAGTYLIIFNAITATAGQLVLAINGTELPYTVTGADTGAPLSITTVATVTANSALTVINPTAATTDITLAASAGGTDAVAATLVIVRLA
jgi:hypothetical protein